LKLLFIILSGPEDIERARQGLRIARNIIREKLAKSLRLLFVGPGVRLLDPDNPHYDLVKNFLAEIVGHAYIAACAGNLRAFNLESKVDKNLVVFDDSTAVVAEAVSEGFTVITF